ncbi:MAG: heavy-metal-associated domain-containing protein [Acidobacteria bacterium]|nr:heavy-metal-associated domain-containing protein [Acidobacteriota bacterium]
MARGSVRIRRITLWACIGLALITAVVVGVREVRRAREITPEHSPATSAVRASARAEIAIDGMDCVMCAAGLQNKLRTLPGVSKAEVSYQDKRALIEFDPAVIARARLVEVIEGDGFKVVAQDSQASSSASPHTRAR